MREQKSSKEAESAGTSPTPDGNSEGKGNDTTSKPAKAERPPRSPDTMPTVLGVGFWIVVIGIFLLARFWNKSADIVLEVAPADPLVVNGVVLYDGATVNAGYVQLTLDEPKTKRFLSSTILPVTNQGRFATSGQLRFNSTATNKQLRITAAFEGQMPSKDGKTLSHVSGEAVVYTNYSPPIAKFNLWAGACVLAGLLSVLMVLFTGSMSRRKARCLFAVTYSCTFISLAVPIAVILVVSQNNYFVDVMEESPVGLVKAKAKGVSDPQWLLNIGGIVQSGLSDVELLKASAAAANARMQTNGAADATLIQARGGGSSASAEDRIVGPQIVGGLAIPFYVVILAMFGAGINMTRRVPDIQKRYDLESLPRSTTNPVTATLSAPITPFLSRAPASDNLGQANTVSGIRQEIIESYMGLLSAPFLAIAIYYVLQVVATSVAEPILVLMAFATGLISDSVVTWIIDYAQDFLGKNKKQKADVAPAPGESKSAEPPKPASPLRETVPAPADNGNAPVP